MPRVTRTCTYQDCDKRHEANGYCTKHNARFKRYGSPGIAYGANEDTKMKLCRGCGLTLSFSMFYSTARVKGAGIRGRCKTCLKDEEIQRRYNISLRDFEIRLFEDQRGVCPLCLTTAPTIQEMLEDRFWTIDHDHECCPTETHSCGACVRGILCVPCNTSLSNRASQDGWFDRAAEYLKR